MYHQEDETTSAAAEPPKPALKLWRHIFGGERGLLQVWSGVRGSDGAIPKETIRDNFFNYPGSAQSAAQWALEKSEQGREVYFCAHLLTRAKRNKEHAASVRALWFEMDGVELPNGHLRPTAVVESSPRHYHGYLRLADSLPPEVAERLNKRLAHEIGADMSGYDLTQLLRVPGTTNHKYAERPLVKLLGVRGDHEYSPRELEESLRELQEGRPEPGSDAGVLLDEPPVVLDPEALKVWRGEKPKAKVDTGELDKSATLMKIARVLFDAGANKRVVADALAERDRTLGYEKYSGNRDGGRKEYERIFDKLALSGRNRRAGEHFGKDEKPEGNAEPLRMDEAAYRGLFGDVVEVIDPHTEGDPVAVLAGMLVAFGNAMGRGPYVQIGATKHRTNLFVGTVGATAKGRKGDAWKPVKEAMHAADSAWAEERIASGLSSGEGLIAEVRDPTEAPDGEGGTKVVDRGVSDKRLLVMEGELAQALKVIKREGNTLSPVLRNAWDGETLRTMVKHSPHRATNPHTSILGHITLEELLKHLTETEMANGLANRFVWLLVKRSKLLPRGGEWNTVNLAPLAKKIVSALEFGNRELRLAWDDAGGRLWDEVYEALTEDRDGMLGAVTARAEAQTLRLSMLYALADSSHVIGRSHVESALAVWEFAEESAKRIFGDATGDADADKAFSALKASEAGNLTRTEVSAVFDRHKSRKDLDRIRETLLRAKKIRVSLEEEEGSAKRVERWHAA